MNDQARGPNFNRGPPMRPPFDGDRNNMNRNMNPNNNNMRIKTEPSPGDVNYWTNYENHFPPSPPLNGGNPSQRPRPPMPPNMNGPRARENSPSGFMGPNNMNQRNSGPPNPSMMGNNGPRNYPMQNGNPPIKYENDRMGPPMDRGRPNPNYPPNHGGNLNMPMSQQGDLSMLEKERLFRNQLRELEEKNLELDGKNNLLKKQYEQLNTECQEKLELALNEVRKATVVEKNLKAEKKELEAAITKLNNGEPVPYIERASEKALAEERVEVIVKREEYNTTAELKEKYKEVFSMVSKLKAEKSQLQMVNERISKENEKWSAQIKQGGIVKDKEQDKQDKARLEDALKANIANKLHLGAMEKKMKKLEEEKERLEKEKKILLIKCKEARDQAAKNAASSTDSEEFKKMEKEMTELRRNNERVKNANADLIAKSKKNLEVALNEVKKSNGAKKEKEAEVEEKNKEISKLKEDLKKLHNLCKDFQNKNSKMKKQYDELANSKGKLKQVNSAEITMLEDSAKQLLSQISSLRNAGGGNRNTSHDDTEVSERAEKRLRTDVKKEIHSDREDSSRNKKKNDPHKDKENVQIKREARSPTKHISNNTRNESSEEQIASSLEQSIEQLESMESMDN